MLIKSIVKLFSKITVRLLLFNILLIFIPIAFFFYLDIYENKLLIAQENSMVMQGRIISSSLFNSTGLDKEADKLIRNLNRDVTSRIRVLDPSGNLLADSSSNIHYISENKNIEDNEYNVSKISKYSIDQNILYKLVRFPLNLVRYILRGPIESANGTEFYGEHRYLEGYELQQSLKGLYGATTRISGGERSVTLYISLPIFNDKGDITGAVLLSKSTYRILQDLYQIRLEILKIFLLSMVFAVIISLILSKTIASPLKSLRNQAKEIVDKNGRLITHFRKSRRLDEIGDLNISLQELTRKLQSYLEKTEAFAADLSHEFKNPLASIKSATEIIKEMCPDENKFLDIIDSEVSRLNRLITDVREISSIDSQIEPLDCEVVNPVSVIETLISGFKLRNKRINFEILASSDKSIYISPIKFSRVIENIISNAVSFSSPDSSIRVYIDSDSDFLVITIEDEGPGIPEENLGKIFNRFFTYRENNINRNSGLGLSISLAIINSYGGNIIAYNNDSGACFKITLPV